MRNLWISCRADGIFAAVLLIGLAAGAELGAQPGNDDCANAEPAFLGPNFTDTSLATTDGPIFSPACTEEAVAGGLPQIFNDVWFSFSPPMSGTLVVETCGAGTSHPDTAIALYQGLSCPPTALVVCADEGPTPICPGTVSYLFANVTSGVPYLIRVGGYANGQTGPVELTLSFVTPPGNDDCADQIPISDGVTNFDSRVASTDGAALIPAVCNLGAFGTEQIYRDLWFVYTATQSGLALLSTCNITAWDTRLAVYDSLACPANPNDVIACNDDGPGCAGFSSALTFTTVVGQDYLIRIGGYDGADGGPGQVSITYSTALLNDNCSSPLPLVVGDNPFDTTLATTDGPPHASPAVCNSVGDELIESDVWFEFVAPQDGLVQMSTCPDPGFDSQIAAYPDQPCMVDPLSVIACNDDDPACSAQPFRSTIRFDVTMGTTTIIRVGGYSEFDGGPGIVRVQYVPRPVENLTCTPVTATDSSLAWTLPAGGPYGDAIRIYENGSLYATLAGNATSYSYAPGVPPTFPLELCVAGVTGAIESPLACCTLDCAALDLACTYDCIGDTATLTWSPNAVALSYDVFRNGVQIGAALPGSQTSLTDLDPSLGAVGTVTSYEVIAGCINGQLAGSTCDLDISDPSPAQDLILALERVAGTGDIDSAAALDAALQGNGRTTAILNRTFADFACLQPLIDAAEVIWVLTGTYPDDYRLSAAEGDLLAGYQAAGKAMYFESGDHWAFAHEASLLDARDGIDETGSVDGNDTLTSLDGQGPLSALSAIVYSQDQAGVDYNDQLALSTTDPATGQAIWRNDDDTMTLEPDSIVGVLATSPTGGRMVSSSWEFGGFALDPLNPSASDPAREDLAAEYVGILVPTGTPFIRGNCNADLAGVNIADAVFVLGFLFPGPGGPNAITCSDACDANDDGGLNIADAVSMLASLFGSPAVPLPAPNAASGCGLDPTDADPLDCATAPGGC